MVEDRVLQVKAKAWIEVDGNDILGPGGYIILKTLKEQGSISKTAKALGMSYKFIWRYIRRIEENTGIRITEKWRGGSSFGGTRLTEEGELFLKLYEEVLEKLNKLANEYTEKFRKMLILKKE